MSRSEAAMHGRWTQRRTLSSGRLADAEVDELALAEVAELQRGVLRERRAGVLVVQRHFEQVAQQRLVRQHRLPQDAVHRGGQVTAQQREEAACPRLQGRSKSASTPRRASSRLELRGGAAGSAPPLAGCTAALPALTGLPWSAVCWLCQRVKQGRRRAMLVHLCNEQLVHEV